MIARFWIEEKSAPLVAYVEGHGTATVMYACHQAGLPHMEFRTGWNAICGHNHPAFAVHGDRLAEIEVSLKEFKLEDFPTWDEWAETQRPILSEKSHLFNSDYSAIALMGLPEAQSFFEKVLRQKREDPESAYFVDYSPMAKIQKAVSEKLGHLAGRASLFLAIDPAESPWRSLADYRHRCTDYDFRKKSDEECVGLRRHFGMELFEIFCVLEEFRDQISDIPTWKNLLRYPPRYSGEILRVID